MSSVCMYGWLLSFSREVSRICVVGWSVFEGLTIGSTVAQATGEGRLGIGVRSAVGGGRGEGARARGGWSFVD